MAINSINNYVSAASTVATDSKVSSKKTESSKNDTSTGVIYEKGSSDKSSSSQKTQNSALIAKMKADSDSRISQLRGIVEQMMSKQGAAIGKADDMWSFLAGGNFTVSADVKAQAQADIAEDGYWGVNQTSDRILDFAKALSGNDKSKAQELADAFKKGFDQATKAWGGKLPDISQQTFASFSSYRGARQICTQACDFSRYSRKKEAAKPAASFILLYPLYLFLPAIALLPVLP